MKFKSAFPYITAFLLVPLCIAVGVFAFRGKAYLPVSVCIALLSCLPFFLAFEKKNGNVQLAVILAVMTALSVLGRFAFAAIPHFKPVSAIVIITGMYLGAQSGFLCGALSAVLSNILFGQGPWTPFQMLAWGLIGLFAALLGGILKKTKSRLRFSVRSRAFSTRLSWIYGQCSGGRNFRSRAILPPSPHPASSCSFMPRQM